MLCGRTVEHNQIVNSVYCKVYNLHCTAYSGLSFICIVYMAKCNVYSIECNVCNVYGVKFIVEC